MSALGIERGPARLQVLPKLLVDLLVQMTATGNSVRHGTKFGGKDLTDLATRHTFSRLLAPTRPALDFVLRVT